MKLENITETQERRRRLYEDACATAHALDLVGERWALLVMRELMLGPRRYKLPPPAATQVYELTEWGYESEPIFQALGRWAARSPAHDPSLPFSTVSLILSLRTMFDARRAHGIDARIGFRLGEETFLGHITPKSIEIMRGPLEEADVVFTGSAANIARAIYAGQPIDGLETDGVLQIEGDRAVAEQFVSLFPLPPKVQRQP
jgi:hypothetical protein